MNYGQIKMTIKHSKNYDEKFSSYWFVLNKVLQHICYLPVKFHRSGLKNCWKKSANKLGTYYSLLAHLTANILILYFQCSQKEQVMMHDVYFLDDIYDFFTYLSNKTLCCGHIPKLCLIVSISVLISLS